MGEGPLLTRRFPSFVPVLSTILILYPHSFEIADSSSLIIFASSPFGVLGTKNTEMTSISFFTFVIVFFCASMFSEDSAWWLASEDFLKFFQYPFRVLFIDFLTRSRTLGRYHISFSSSFFLSRFSWASSSVCHMNSPFSSASCFLLK